MDDYEYYGLFLTQESELMKKRTGWYLDHCIVL